MELLIKEGLETAISCPDAACPKQGHLQESEARTGEDSASCDQGGVGSVLAELHRGPALSLLCSLFLVFLPQIECMVAAEIMQRYKKLQFERGGCPSKFVGYEPRDRIRAAGGSVSGR